MVEDMCLTMMDKLFSSDITSTMCKYSHYENESRNEHFKFEFPKHLFDSPPTKISYTVDYVTGGIEKSLTITVNNIT